MRMYVLVILMYGIGVEGLNETSEWTWSWRSSVAVVTYWTTSQLIPDASYVSHNSDYIKQCSPGLIEQSRYTEMNKDRQEYFSHWKKAHTYWNVAFTSTNLLWELSLMSSWNSNERIPCGGLFRAACCSSSFVDTFLSFVTYFVTWDGYHQFGSVSVGVYNFLFFFFFKVGKFPLRKWKSWYFVFIFSLLRGKIWSILLAC